MANQSAKHHYIPEFYLKCFTGDDGRLAVYDLQKQRLKTKRLYPSQIYFEYHRNTFEINGVKDDLIEKMYGTYETLFSSTFQKIKNQIGGSGLSVLI